MTTETVTLFLALLAVGAQTVVIAAAGLALAARLSAAGRRARAAAVESVAPSALPLAFLVAAVSTLGSLYLSEVAQFVPCRLCWYQRIAMYPQVLLLGLAWWRRDTGIRTYAIPLAVAGGAVSAYHMLVERFPQLESTACDPAAPCTVIWVERLGYLTIPTMAFSAFALIVTLLAAARRSVPAPQ